MNHQGQLQIDPGTIPGDGMSGIVELVVPYIGQSATGALLRRAVALTAGLNARISLVAILEVPYPREFGCPTATHSYLVEQLIELSAGCPLPVEAQVVLARNLADGYRHALRPGSTVLVGTRKSLWRTQEEKLARALVADGHKVALLHIA